MVLAINLLEQTSKDGIGNRTSSGIESQRGQRNLHEFVLWSGILALMTADVWTA